MLTCLHCTKVKQEVPAERLSQADCFFVFPARGVQVQELCSKVEIVGSARLSSLCSFSSENDSIMREAEHWILYSLILSVIDNILYHAGRA